VSSTYASISMVVIKDHSIAVVAIVAFTRLAPSFSAGS
jgi:hypothetical protein